VSDRLVATVNACCSLKIALRIKAHIQCHRQSPQITCINLFQPQGKRQASKNSAPLPVERILLVSVHPSAHDPIARDHFNAKDTTDIERILEIAFFLLHKFIMSAFPECKACGSARSLTSEVRIETVAAAWGLAGN
jgi:hypothetical protein